MPLVNKKDSLSPPEDSYHLSSLPVVVDWFLWWNRLLFKGHIGLFLSSGFPAVSRQIPHKGGAELSLTRLLIFDFHCLLMHLVQLVNTNSLLRRTKIERRVLSYYQYCWCHYWHIYFTCWLGIKNVIPLLLFMVTGVPWWPPSAFRARPEVSALKGSDNDGKMKDVKEPSWCEVQR